VTFSKAWLAVLEARRRPEEPSPVLRAVRADKAASRPVLRVRSRLPFLDDATGGGFVRGAVYLLHGAPGGGKSTLLGQVCSHIPQSVYVSSEESESQVGQRFIRLGCRDQLIISDTDISAALITAPLVVVDSISTMRPGLLSAAETMVEHARRTGSVVVMICHETKDGQHAGPRKLEHLIDCTLSLWREPRLLCVEKNRFGAAPFAIALQLGEKGFSHA
jgi:DNA repair protein RadA/Sms